MKVNIIGLGWLGLPLADLFLSKGASVYGSTRNKLKLEVLDSRIRCKLYDLYSHSPNIFPNEYFRDAHLILNIPPGRNDFQPNEFISRLNALARHAILSEVKQLIFISTTSVFGGVESKITNDSIPNPLTKSGQAHYAIETYLLSEFPNKVSILRPAGLVGDDRHPIYTLVKRPIVANGSFPVNLVHASDVITAIECIVEKQLVNSALNICSREHPSKKDYYQWCANSLNLKPPTFEQNADMSARDKGKWIDASETFDVLGFHPKFPSPYDFI